MREIKACIFDLDGTLLETLTSLWYCASRSLKKEGLKELPKDRFRYYVGDGALTQVERYLRDTEIIGEPSENALSKRGIRVPGRISPQGIPDPHDPENLDYYYKSYMEELDRYADYEVRPYDGIPEVLEEMKKKGLKLAVFSNKPDAAAQKVIKKYFKDTFDIVLGKRDELPKKPDPAGALMIAKDFGIAPENIMYMGDTNTDMQTGRAAEMLTVGVLWGFRDRKELEENHADAIVSRPEELLKFIK